MVTLSKYGAKYNRLVLNLEGLSSEAKPTVYFYEYDANGREVSKMQIQNGSIFTEIDTGNTYMYDAANTTWYQVSIGGGGTSGGIILVGETTTSLTDEATTNPITVDGQSYTAQPNDAVIYGSKEFLFDGTKWHEFGDLSGLASKDIGAMTGYAKAQTASAIATTDTLNQAVGKLEKGLDGKQDTIDSNHTLDGGLVSPLTGYEKSETGGQDVSPNDSLNGALGKIEKRVSDNENDILSEQAKTTGMSEGGSNYITVGGIRLYLDDSAPTGDIPDGSYGLF